MLRVISILLCCAPVHGITHWSDCGQEESNNTAFTFHSFDITPDPVLIPGTVRVSLNLTLDRHVERLYVDIEFYKIMDNVSVPVPCREACHNIDACLFLLRTEHGLTSIPAGIGVQVDRILLDSLGHPAQCPATPGNLDLHNAKLYVDFHTGLPLEFVNGGYTVKIFIKDVPKTLNSSNVLGCFEFGAGIKYKI